ncbi:MAG: lysostaphin resistance A-like protein [Kiritimatiellia bacterium]
MSRETADAGAPLTSVSPLKLTLRAWPVIALATIGLCFLTQTVAKWFGVELPDQQNVESVRQCLAQVFASLKHLLTALLLVLQILVIMPVLEEIYFRHFIFRRNLLPLSLQNLAYMLLPTAALLTGGALLAFAPGVRALVLASFPSSTPWLCYGLALVGFAVVEYVLRTFVCRLIGKLSITILYVFSAALFSAAHYIAQPWPDAAFIALFFFGLAQCWLYRKTERLWCPMLNHALFNLTNLVLLIVIPEG